MITAARNAKYRVPLGSQAFFQWHSENRYTTSAQNTPFWAQPDGKWTSSGAAEVEGGGSCFLTSSGEIACP